MTSTSGNEASCVRLTACVFPQPASHWYSNVSCPVLPRKRSRHISKGTGVYVCFAEPSPSEISVTGTPRLKTSALSTRYLTRRHPKHSRRCSNPNEKISVGSPSPVTMMGRHASPTPKTLTWCATSRLMVISPEHGQQMSKELFCILLSHRSKLCVTFSNERFEPGGLEPNLPRCMLWCRMRKRIRGR